MRVLDIGCGYSLRAVAEFPGAYIQSIDKQMGWDITVQGLPTGPWDVLFAHHLIEHLVNPDAFLEACRRVMDDDTLLILGTPNLASWVNRLLLLIGYLPISVEVSTRYLVGRLPRWNVGVPTGHVRVFTVPALVQLLQKHGFHVIRVVGERSTAQAPWWVRVVDGWLTRYPTLATAVRVEARKRRELCG